MKQFKNMKGKNLGILALTLLLSSGSDNLQITTGVQAHRLSEQALAWNMISSNSNSHTNEKKHHKKSHKKKHSKKQKHKEEEESESESEESEDESKEDKQQTDDQKIDDGSNIQHDEESTEAQAISQKAATGLQNLQSEDASLQDMYQFSKVIANGKTAAEALKEEQDKLKQMQAIAQKENEQRMEALQQETEIEKQEQEQRQVAIDITTRKMLAKQYENMMIEDEAKERADGGGSSLQVVADQQAEQNYAINIYKGSGEMSGMLDSMAKDAEKQRQIQEAKDIENSILQKKIADNTPNAEAGEASILKDDAAMAIFSGLIAKQEQ